VAEVGGGDGETDAILPGAAAVVGRGGAGMEAEAAGDAGLDAETTALGESLGDKNILRLIPSAMEKMIVRTIASGVSIASMKFFAQSIFWFTARALLLAMAAPMTATIALTTATTVVSIVAVSRKAY
jgi:hypothetical protein